MRFDFETTEERDAFKELAYEVLGVAGHNLEETDLEFDCGTIYANQLTSLYCGEEISNNSVDKDAQ